MIHALSVMVIIILSIELWGEHNRAEAFKESAALWREAYWKKAQREQREAK